MIGYVFKRVEMKFLLTETQYAAILPIVAARSQPDAYGKTTVQSVYYDTPDFRLIRASLEAPVFKEKLRLRRYGIDGDGTVFLEMKRKYDGVVYKRRIGCRENEVERILAGDIPDTQIGREIGYFLSYYPVLSPKVLILCEREAWFSEKEDLRVTFDRNVRFRTDALDFHAPPDGTPLLPPGTVLMECKTGTALPLWLTRAFFEAGIIKTSFSKYGAAYERMRASAE